MLKHFLSTAAVLALMAGPAYAQADQAGTGSASGSTMSPAAGQTEGTSTGAGAAADSAATSGTATESGAASSGSTGAPQDSASTAASGATASSAAGETFLTDQSEGQWRADKLMGADVKNTQDESIGKINDLVFSEEGRIEAAVVSVGGFLGIGAKNVALSWDQLQIHSSEAGDEITVSMTKEQLENAPSFKTLEDKRSEEAAANAQMQQGTTPPATGMGTSN